MQPQLSPVGTAASPSEKSRASSNCSLMAVAPVLSTYPALPSSPTGNSRMSCRGCCKEQWELNAAATTAARMARGILIWSPCTVVRLDRRLSAWDIRFMAPQGGRGGGKGGAPAGLEGILPPPPSPSPPYNHPPPPTAPPP